MMKYNRYTKRIYYTFKDFLKTFQATANNPLEFENANMSIYTIYAAMYSNPTIKSDTQTALNGTEAKTLLGKHLITKNYEMVVAYEDLDIHEDTPTMTNEHRIEVYEDFIINMVNIFLATYQRYKRILASYQAKESSLLAQISSTNTNRTRFNDTPQDSEQTFFEDDYHTTNVTLNEATINSDGSTPMQRLEEIRSMYANVYAEWCNEFDSLFMGEN